MKKFTQYREESINENKIHARYMELSDKIFFGLKEILKGEGYEIKEGEKVDTFLVEISEEIAKGVVDPKTIPDSGQQELFENFKEDDPYVNLINNTYPTDDGYEVYFDDNYIELIEGDHYLIQLPYPELGETKSDGGYEVYLEDTGRYLEFIKDGKVLTTLYIGDL